jgi:hypothetical protein
MYREMDNYEDALYETYDLSDKLSEIQDMIQYGYPKEELQPKLARFRQQAVDLNRMIEDSTGTIEE